LQDKKEMVYFWKRITDKLHCKRKNWILQLKFTKQFGFIELNRDKIIYTLMKKRNINLTVGWWMCKPVKGGGIYINELAVTLKLHNLKQ
jgi:hypothetical protein